MTGYAQVGCGAMIADHVVEEFLALLAARDAGAQPRGGAIAECAPRIRAALREGGGALAMEKVRHGRLQKDDLGRSFLSYAFAAT